MKNQPSSVIIMPFVLKDEMKKRFLEIFGEDYDKTIEYLKKPLPKVIRVNTIKISRDELISRLRERGWGIEKIRWYQDALKVETNEKVGTTIEYALGYYYVQDAASMIPPLVMELKEDLIVLDMCAAPGSKTTQMAQLMKNRGLIVANDITEERIRKLISNINRFGVANVVTTRINGIYFKYKKLKFDRVLVDAPCSSEGTIRRSYDILRKWNVKNIKRLSRLQKGLIDSAFRSLKEGGILVYSTCTFEPEENEEVINWLLEKHDNAEIIPIKIDGLKTRPGFTEWRGKRFCNDLKYSIRLFPQDNDTEGFFVAKIRRKE